MNGKPRDQIDTDLADGRPTISPVADSLALRTAALMSRSESTSLFNGLEYRAHRSPAWSDWMDAPARYLSEFDAATATSIETHLAELHGRMIRRAKARGWEVDD
jgi:hypothetical protein